MNYHWNWHIFFEPAPDGTGSYLDMLLSGLVLTLKTGICAWILALLFGSGPLSPLLWTLIVLRKLVLAVLWLYVVMIFFYGIAGFLMQGGSSPIYEVLAYVCDPLLNRIRKIIPSIVAGLDLSFLWAIIALQASIILIGEIRL